MSQPKLDFSRRTALKLATAASALPLVSNQAGAAMSEEFQSFVPQEKNLDPKVVQTLYERGAPSKWAGDQLKFIGMPIGGLCCGQVYLGGDGQLWHWDICTTPTGWDMSGLSSGKHYANPIVPHFPIGHGFTVQIDDNVEIDLPNKLWNCEFENHYPIGIVRYQSKDLPIRIVQEAFSPFIPLETEDSSLPLIVQRFSVTNDSQKNVWVAMRCRLQDPIGSPMRQDKRILSQHKEIQEPRFTAIQFQSVVKPETEVQTLRPRIVFEDFSKSSYDGWKVTGTAFGEGPMLSKELPDRYKSANPVGTAFVNSHQSRSGEDSVNADKHVGTLLSREFKIERNFINFWIGGGAHAGKTCLNLLIDGKVVLSETGRNSLQLRKASFDVKRFAGKTAQIQILDQETGGWGHITVDHIRFEDAPDLDEVPADQHQEFGSMAIAVCSKAEGKVVRYRGSNQETAQLYQELYLKPGETKSISFLLAWFFPNYGRPTDSFAEITGISKLKKHYAKRFGSALDVLRYFAKHERKLSDATRLWDKTWYDSTLPHYFLERSIIPIDCLQTATSHRFDSGRFYGWEGVYCCPGTCQHVWNYAQAAARLFPDLERSARVHADYGISWQPDGTIWYRGESGRHMAHDGQAGTILRTYREHSTSKDSKFLTVNWQKIKKSIERLIADDPNKDGMWEGEQYNTLDSSWYGKISWISSLYIAALRAGVEMANEMGDPDFAKELMKITESGAKLIVKETYNGEYFAMVRDPAHPRAPGHGPGCHIDQVFGDSFLHMVGLPPNLPKNEVKSGLKSIWKYNYTPDAGGYMKAMQSVIKGGRWYAMPGEPGLLMTSFPKGGAKESKGEGNPDWMVGYFNECMNGFEYQAAAHMIADGMVTEGLAIVHALHSRYTNGTRNPYNEVECSDHYSRSMASYGAFLTACGFSYHGPKGEMAFDPKMPGNRFKCAFTAAEGWGSYEQVKSEKGLIASLTLNFGKLSLTQIAIRHAKGMRLINTTLGKSKLHAQFENGVVKFEKPLKMSSGQGLTLAFVESS